MARSTASRGAKEPAPARKRSSTAKSVVTHQSSIVESDDGFFWRDSETDALVGPFRTRAAAIADRDSPGPLDAGADDLAAATDTDGVHEIEAAIGIDDFIDPDTGEPTHGYEPHVRDDH
jgi:hypothetical protein